VPPIHVLKKRYPNLIGRPVSTERPAGRGAEWVPAADGRQADGGAKTYTVPPGGITLKKVAKEAFGDELEWRRVWDLNPKYSPQEVVPEGTKLVLPSDAKVGR
jgi:hypothetical protein